MLLRKYFLNILLIIENGMSSNLANVFRPREPNHSVREDADHTLSPPDMLMMTKSITQALQPRDTREEPLEPADSDTSNSSTRGKLFSPLTFSRAKNQFREGTTPKPRGH